MDFWDITKLLIRRWMIVVPLGALSVVLAVVAMKQVSPDYVATAYVQLVPPVAGQTKPGEATVDQRNPFIGLGLQTIGNAAIVTVTDVSVGDQLHAAGLTDSYTVTMAPTSPLITFEVVGHSEEQARRSADELISRFDKSIADIQNRYGVARTDLISSVRLDAGTNIKESTSKVKRALVAVAGAGILMTIAATVGADAWLRRRQRRRAGDNAVPAPGAGRAPLSSGASAPVAHVNGDLRPSPSLAHAANGTNGGSTAGVGATTGRDSGPEGSNSELTQPINLQVPLETRKAERDSERARAMQAADATIVLPRVLPTPLPRTGEGE